MIKRVFDNASTSLEPGQGEGSWDTSLKLLSMHIKRITKDEETKVKGGREKTREKKRREEKERKENRKRKKKNEKEKKGKRELNMKAKLHPNCFVTCEWLNSDLCYTWEIGGALPTKNARPCIV